MGRWMQARPMKKRTSRLENVKTQEKRPTKWYELELEPGHECMAPGKKQLKNRRRKTRRLQDLKTREARPTKQDCNACAALFLWRNACAGWFLCFTRRLKIDELVHYLHSKTEDGVWYRLKTCRKYWEQHALVEVRYRCEDAKTENWICNYRLKTCARCWGHQTTVEDLHRV